MTNNAVFSKPERRMLGLSLHGWENAMVVCLIIAGGFALFAGAATWAVVRLQRAELEASREELDKYKLDTTAKITEAEARTKEAELRLAELRERASPRKIKGEQFLKILKNKPKAPVEIIFVRDDPDCFQLAMQIRDFLKQAKWDVKEIRAIENKDMTPRLAQYTSSMAVGGQPHGVTVVMRATSQADFDREMQKNPLSPDEPVDTARKALSKALGDSFGTISGGISYDTGIPGALLVVVGPKFNLN